MVCQRVVMASTAAGEVAGSRSTLVWMCSVNAGLIHTCIDTPFVHRELDGHNCKCCAFGQQFVGGL
jgi:hypothetical protein